MDFSLIEETTDEIDWSDIVETSPIPTLLVANGWGERDRRGQINYANEAARVAFGAHPADDLVRTSIFQLIHADDRPVIDELLGIGIEPVACAEVTPSGREGSRVSGVRVADSHSDTFTLHLRASANNQIIVQAVRSDGWAAITNVMAEQKRFRTALMELSELAHTTQDDDDFYQRLLEGAVEVVPGAQGGSVQLNIPGSTAFRFVAAVGYDLEGLQQHELDKADFFRDTLDPAAQIVRDFGNAVRSDEIDEWLKTVGRLDEIVVNVSAPVISGGLPVAFLALDNFEDPAAMNETSVEMTTVLSRLIGELWRRREWEAELRTEREAFRHLALHDPLTGLANRRSLERCLQDTMTSSRTLRLPSSVLFVDLDDFKGVNDRLGHEVGDRLLIGVANALRDVVRDGDTVGRWGGDEFLVLPNRVSSPDNALMLARRILSRFEQEIDLGDGLMYRARLSVGVGWTADSSIPLDQLVHCADEALYDAKAAGKGVARSRTVGESV